MKLLTIALTLSLSTAFASGGMKKMADKKIGKKSLSITPSKSEVKWIGTKVTGSHDGKVKIQSGKLMFNGAKLVGGEIVVDMTSISVDDIKDSGTNAKLVGHLKNDDFFSVDKFKTATLKINKATMKDGKYNVNGDLTIKGQTKPINFTAKASMSSGKASLNASLKVDRTKYGVKYGSGKFFDNLGDKMIHDEFTLNVKVMAN